MRRSPSSFRRRRPWFCLDADCPSHGRTPVSLGPGTGARPDTGVGQRAGAEGGWPRVHGGRPLHHAPRPRRARSRAWPCRAPSLADPAAKPARSTPSGQEAGLCPVRERRRPRIPRAPPRGCRDHCRSPTTRWPCGRAGDAFGQAKQGGRVLRAGCRSREHEKGEAAAGRRARHRTAPAGAAPRANNAPLAPIFAASTLAAARAGARDRHRRRAQPRVAPGFHAPTREQDRGTLARGLIQNTHEDCILRATSRF